MPIIFQRYYPFRNILFFAGEGLLIFLAINIIYLQSAGVEIFILTFPVQLLRALLITAIFQLSLYFFDLYDLSEVLAPPEIAARIVQSLGVGCVLLAAVYYFFPLATLPLPIFWWSFLAVCTSIFIWRSFYAYVLNTKFFTESVIILGTGELAGDIADEIGRKNSGFNIISFIGTKKTDSHLPEAIPVREDHDDLPEFCKKMNIDRIIIAMDDRRGTTPFQELLQCKFMGFPIEYGINFYERITGKILVEKVHPDWIIYSSGFCKRRLLTFSKLLLDLALALFGLIVTLPITLTSALIIRLESPGPVFYLQERVGEHGRIFKVIKFRSMRQDAEKDGPVWARQDDTRITRFGGIMRKTRIDELPQMWNVLKGDMSFVGPRPERPVFVEQLTRVIPYYSIRHIIKPGISGWAQICYRYGASEEDALRKLEYDLYYIKYMSIQMDCRVIFQTIKTVLFQKGSR